MKTSDNPSQTVFHRNASIYFTLRTGRARILAGLLRYGELGADGGAEGVGEGLAEALDVGVVLGFDHDAGELLGAGIAEHDAAVFAERGLGFGKCTRNF